MVRPLDVVRVLVLGIVLLFGCACCSSSCSSVGVLPSMRMLRRIAISIERIARLVIVRERLAGGLLSLLLITAAALQGLHDGCLM